LLILDVDASLPMWLVMNDLGQEIKCFNVRDGHGLKLLMRYRITVALLTWTTIGGGATPGPETWALRNVHQRVWDKLPPMKK
jgi:3-deoxy-D-manno-octulosonate 8-phosphate phosphatase (KDO 8-P phosphatase)